MWGYRQILAVAVAAVLAGAAADSEAKRFGAKSSSRATESASTLPAATAKFRGGSDSSAGGAMVGAVAGGVAGSAVARALSAEEKAQIDADKAATAELQRLSKLSDFDRKVQIEEAAKRAETEAKANEQRFKAEQAAREAAERHRLAEAEARRRQAEAQREEQQRQAIAREKSCVIKTAMTDAEIAHCKWAWSVPPPG